MGDSYFYMYLELVSGGSLRDLLKQYRGPLDVALARNYGQQMLKGLTFLHSKEVVHRDLKPANVLITTEGVLKLADFGTAFDLSALTRTAEGKIQTFCGTPPFMSPEVVRREEYTTASDVWSFGVLMFEMLTGRLPFEQKGIRELLNEIACGSNRPAWPSDHRVHINLRLLVVGCLARDSAMRPSAESLLNNLATTGNLTVGTSTEPESDALSSATCTESWISTWGEN